MFDTPNRYGRARTRQARQARQARAALLLASTLAALGPPLDAAAQDVVQPWQHIGDTLASVYGWPNVMFHVGAAALTPLLVHTADTPVQDYFQIHDPLTNDFARATYVAGYIVPIAVPATLYAGGLLAHDAELASGGAAAIQAIVLQAVVVNTLKWITDRAGPFPDGDPRAKRSSSRWFRSSNDPTDFDFNPFALSGALRWPSGHAASMFALVSALSAFYPDEVWIAAIGYPSAVAVGLGMIEGDYHWMSDVVAGALIGHIIGWVTGSEFRSAFDAQQRATRAHGAARSSRVQLRLLPTATGLTLTGILP